MPTTLAALAGGVIVCPGVTIGQDTVGGPGGVAVYPGPCRGRRSARRARLSPARDRRRGSRRGPVTLDVSDCRIHALDGPRQPPPAPLRFARALQQCATGPPQQPCSRDAAVSTYVRRTAGRRQCGRALLAAIALAGQTAPMEPRTPRSRRSTPRAGGDEWPRRPLRGLRRANGVEAPSLRPTRRGCATALPSGACPSPGSGGVRWPSRSWLIPTACCASATARRPGTRRTA